MAKNQTKTKEIINKLSSEWDSLDGQEIKPFRQGLDLTKYPHSIFEIEFEGFEEFSYEYQNEERRATAILGKVKKTIPDGVVKPGEYSIFGRGQLVWLLKNFNIKEGQSLYVQYTGKEGNFHRFKVKVKS